MRSITLPNRRLMPVTEARAILGGIGRTTLYEIVAKGDLQIVKLGRRTFFRAEQVFEYIEKLATT